MGKKSKAEEGNESSRPQDLVRNEIDNSSKKQEDQVKCLKVLLEQSSSNMSFSMKILEINLL